MPRTAALLCVRNARKTLHWWIAHHLAVGFDTLLICDDHSDDGTWEFLQNAAHRYDIRIAQTDLSIGETITRRETAQRELVRTSGESLGWILPLAVDEYFYPESDSVSSFMQQLKDKYGEETFNLTMSFPIHWCICGLNGHDPDKLDGNSPSPRALFTRHAPQGFNDHKIVRFICRPEALAERLPDPFSWTDHETDWSLARILHDAAASSQGDMRVYYDRNDIALEGIARFSEKSQSIAAFLIQAVLLALCYHLRTLESSPPANTSLRPSFRVFEIISGRSKLSLSIEKRKPVWLDEEAEPTDATMPFYLIGAVSNGTIPPEGIFLWGWCCPLLDKPLSPPRLLARGSCLDDMLDLIPFHLEEKSKDKACLTNMLDQSVFLPEEPVFRFRPLEPEAHPSAMKMVQKLTSLLYYGATASGIIRALRENSWVSPALLASVLLTLPQNEREPLLPPYLQGIFRAVA
ncbi:glycosyltransferase family 2 protein [Acetobacteraceae bacterium ESL0709]|nr:glycosyltransferase family 2 protein [Acetobacteraceae bacterium ESL0697]MDF7678528.1 glycosyltransferase family 2 protein [Acetobacteraceae bacterium ESL0709]